MRHEEDSEQLALMEWVGMRVARYPALKWLIHIPNGGKRNAREAARLRGMGVKRGVSDLFLPVPRGGYHGLWIELKRRDGGRLSEEQRLWLEAMAENGYKTDVCAGWESAAETIEAYMEGSERGWT